MTRPMPAPPAVTSTRRPFTEVSMAPMIAPPRRSRRSDLAGFSEFQFPELADGPGPEAVVRFGLRQLAKAGLAIDRARRRQMRVRPEHELAVALRPREGNALL